MINLNKYYIAKKYEGPSGINPSNGGFVPPAGTGDYNSFLRADGTWSPIENIVYTTGNQSISGLKTFQNNISTNQVKAISDGFFGNQLNLIGGDGAGFGGAVTIMGGTGVNANGAIQLNSVTTINRGTNKSLSVRFFKSGDAGNPVIDISENIFNIQNGLALQVSGITVDPSSYYTNNNPSGFITVVNLSNYATTGQLNQASGNLQSQIDILNVNSIAYAIALG